MVALELVAELRVSWLAGEALVKLEAGVRFADVVTGGWSAGRCDRQRLGGLADIGDDVLHRSALGHESDNAHVLSAVGAYQRQRLEQAGHQHRPDQGSEF